MNKGPKIITFDLSNGFYQGFPFAESASPGILLNDSFTLHISSFTSPCKPHSHTYVRAVDGFVCYGEWKDGKLESKSVM